MTSHMKVHGKSAEWKLHEVKVRAWEYSNRTDFRKKSRSAYNAAIKNQWIDDVCQHMVTEHKPLKQPRKSWSVEEIQTEALKFSTRTEFKARSRAYEAAKRKKLIDVVCAHMTPVHKKWTIEMVRRQAKKYQTRNKFNEGSHQAYLAAHRNGWLERVCNHMN